MLLAVLVTKDLKIVTSGYCSGSGIMNDVTKITHKVLTSQQQRFLCSPEAHPASNKEGPGMKWPRCEVDPSHPSSAQVKNGCHDTSASPVCLHRLETDDFFNLFSAVEIHILLMWSMTGHQMMCD